MIGALLKEVERLQKDVEYWRNLSISQREDADAEVDYLELKIQRLREALETIETWTRNPREYEPSYSSINHTARQALEGVGAE